MAENRTKKRTFAASILPFCQTSEESSKRVNFRKLRVSRPSGQFATRVAVTGYDVPTVTVTNASDANLRQRAIRERWLSGW